MLSLLTSATAMMLAGAPQTTQALFDAATKATEEGRCAEAVPIFDKLAQGAAAKKNPVVAAAIAVRRGQCLLRLSRPAEAEAGLRSGADILARQGGEFGIEARRAYMSLARLEQRRLDYDAGQADAKRALELSTASDRAGPLFLLASFTRFDGDGAAIRDSSEALRLTEGAPGSSKAEIASAQTLAARALMAANRIEEAYALLKKALANNGGLTTRSNLEDIATRYDLAQAALLLNDPAEARRYLVYTGAGRTGKNAFAVSPETQLPECGSVPGLTPESYAVVEFSLKDDGSVDRAEPIYAKGDRDTALAFAREAQAWSWSAEDAQAIPAFYRMMTRVEMRCTRAGDQRDVMVPLTTATASWLEGRGVALPPRDAAEAASLPRWKQAGSGSDTAALAANLGLAAASTIAVSDRVAAAQRASALAVSLDAPQQVRTLADILVVDAPQDYGSRGARRRDLPRRTSAYRALLAKPAIAAEPLGAATLRLKIADVADDRKGLVPDAGALLGAVAEQRDLPERHPLRVSALLALANKAAASGDLAGAATFFQRTGLTEQQCALVGPKPAMKQSGASSSMYPTDAVQMGFEGWARIEYDIAANGRTAQQRTLLAYPPFVFGDAAKAMIRNTRFERSYRPENGVACTANSHNFVFRMP